MDLHLNRTGAHPVFDRQIPVFNIYYPFQWDAEKEDTFGCGMTEFAGTDFSATRSTALYFHFPFCETICNFCPFTRGRFRDHSIISSYLDALLREIELKTARNDLSQLPVRAIFVGGGTPSLLSAEEIREFGAALHRHFDLSQMIEFSFECEVKSVTEDKVIALRDIGVTNARFGLQTFDPFWRDMFDLTASLDQIHAACALFNRHLPRTSFDILYAMNGHTLAQFESDLLKATDMGNNLVDVYPIDNVVTQIKLHAKTRDAGLRPLDADTRFDMNIALREIMRSRGFLPHNGHGYVRATEDELAKDPVVTNSYSFVYHDHVYGHANYEVVGFGVNAISILRGKVVTNPSNRNRYIRQIIENGALEVQISRHGPEIDASRPLVTRLPYHGVLEKDLVQWTEVPDETRAALEDYLEAGLVIDAGAEYRLTELGWQWYVNMMYYSMPHGQRSVLDGFIIHNLRQPGREMATEQVVFAPPAVSLSA